MIKRLICLCLLLFAVLLCSCNGNSEKTATPTPSNTQTDTGIAPTESAVPTTVQTVQTNTGIESVSCKKNGSSVEIAVFDSKLAGEELGVLVLTDEKFVESWTENPSTVIAISQLSLDKNGKGIVNLDVGSDISSFAICISYSGGNYIEQIGG